MKLNQQAPEKRVPFNDGTSLDVHSIFATIQGEGPFCGTPATFIRLAGCNLQCPGCDTDYTSKRVMLTIEEIVQTVQMTRSTREPGLVVITGGEPFRQSLTALLEALCEARFFVQIETNGTLPPPFEIAFEMNTSLRAGAYIVCSPKAGRVNVLLSKQVCAYKYVMHADSVDERDGLPVLALDHTAQPRVGRPHDGFSGVIYLQPMDSQDKKQNALNRAVCVASCLENGYTLQLQVHKLLGME